MSKAKRSKKQMRMEIKRAAIEACADKAGRIDPTRVWQAARDPAHPLHDEFDWDVRRAAEKHWELTARELIREIRFQAVYEQRKVLCPVYVADPRSLGDYVATARIKHREELTAAVMKRELVAIEATINRAMALAMTFDMVDELKRMLQDIVMLKMRLDDDDDRGRGRRRTRRTESPSVVPA